MATKWTVIENFDSESGEVLAHIMPVVEVDGFPTRKAAWDFLHGLESKSLDPDDLPALPMKMTISSQLTSVTR